MEIKYVDYGIANRYTDYIELNKRLKDNPKLHNYILRHELDHKNSFDLLHEFSVNRLENRIRIPHWPSQQFVKRKA